MQRLRPSSCALSSHEVVPAGTIKCRGGAPRCDCAKAHPKRDHGGVAQMLRGSTKNEEDDVVERADLVCHDRFWAGEPTGCQCKRHWSIWSSGYRKRSSPDSHKDNGYSGQLPLYADATKRPRVELWLCAELR